MTATTFLTQRQLMSKNMPADALTGPYAQQQKLLLYVLPVVFAVGGIAFPIGVLLYWTTSNLWTMGQQFYVIRNNPAPGHAGRQGEGGAGHGQGRQARRVAPEAGSRAPERPRTETAARRSGSSRRSRPAQQRKKSGGSRGPANRSTKPEREQHVSDQTQ